MCCQVTAAGDQMARLWDVKSGELLGSFKGHLCSLKSVAFTPQEKGIQSTDSVFWRDLEFDVFSQQMQEDTVFLHSTNHYAYLLY